jgi:undecaprenyl-diphosphatase
MLAAAALMVLCIACSRVVLGAHRVSDVVAGVLVGLAWMTVCLALRCATRGRA